jgi:hypothetical protein
LLGKLQEVILVHTHGKKTYRDVEVQLHLFFKSALDEGEWSVSPYGHFKRGGKAPVPIEYVAGCVPNPVCALQETKISCLRRESKHGFSVLNNEKRTGQIVTWFAGLSFRMKFLLPLIFSVLGG